MKKIYSIFMFLSLLLLINCVPVQAEEISPRLTIDKITAKEGAAIEVPISISNNTGMCGAIVSVSYDKELKLTSISRGEGFPSLFMTNPGNYQSNPVKILWDGLEADTSNGVIAILTFEGVEKEGTYAISASCELGNAVDGNLKSTGFVQGNGEIIIQKHEHSGGMATCINKATCEKCDEEYGEIDAEKHVGKTEIRGAVEATVNSEGYTGDTYCTDCGELIQKGTSIPKLTVNESAAVITVVGDKVAAGRDVTVSVDISKNSGIAGFSYDINYDEQAMTLKSVSAGDLISGNGQLSINKNVVNWYTSDNVKGDGNLLKIVFTVASDAQPSTYPVSISLHDGKKNLVDENGTFVEVNYVGGRIAVTRGMLGDLNGDDDITIADVVILNRHVLGKASISSDRLMFADITGDDDITIGDVVLLNRHVLGKVNILSEEMTALNELVLGTERVGDAENETGMKIYADDINIKAGTTVDIPVKISGNTGLAGFALTVQVPEGYTLNSIKAGNMLANGTFTVNGSNCTWYTADNMTANGVFMTLNVSASKTAKSGQIIIGVKDGKANNLSDEMGCTVAADFDPVTITIDMESECEINGHKGGTATCTEKAVCTVCGKAYGEVDAKNHAGQKETRNKKEATCTETGYTGDTYCKACGVKMSSGKSVAKTGHEWNAGVVTKKPTVTKTGVKTYTCKICKSTRTETIKATGVLPPGTVVKDTASNGTYKMAKDGLTLEFTKMISTTRKTLTIPSVVKVKGTSCKVTSVAANALKNNKKLEKVVIGSNISVIGSNAFSGCTKLTTVSGGSNITKYGDGAFYNCGKLKSISINKKATAIGAKAFYKCISLAKVTLPSTVKSIGSYAFYGCKNLKSITIGSTGLNSDKIGKDAFKGIYSKATISVPRGKATAYKKLLISKGVSKSAIIK